MFLLQQHFSFHISTLWNIIPILSIFGEHQMACVFPSPNANISKLLNSHGGSQADTKLLIRCYWLTNGLTKLPHLTLASRVMECSIKLAFQLQSMLLVNLLYLHLFVGKSQYFFSTAQSMSTNPKNGKEVDGNPPDSPPGLHNKGQVCRMIMIWQWLTTT